MPYLFKLFETNIKYLNLNLDFISVNYNDIIIEKKI